MAQEGINIAISCSLAVQSSHHPLVAVKGRGCTTRRLRILYFDAHTHYHSHHASNSHLQLSERASSAITVGHAICP